MTYGEFLAVFLLPPLLLLASIQRRLKDRPFPSHFVPRNPSLALLFLVTVAVLYTTPWDNYLVARQIWTYPPDRVWGVHLGWVPLEEYLFFVLQTILGTLTFFWASRTGRSQAEPLAWSRRWVYVVATLSAGLAGLAGYGLWIGWEKGTYLCLIASWALPVVAGQWILGGRAFLQHRRILGLTVFPLSLYLWAADTWAIRSGIWHITEATSLGWHLPGGLPVEEALFFTLTTLMVAQGALLVYTWRPGKAFP
ncbi:MAG: lycopene beta-cyclase [Bacteroidia bacterium]|nr:MAG: lycopene beta-cyclase [Bacteroidia bacterium]